MLLNPFFKVACHTDKIQHGSTFVAIPGYKQNGANFIETAISNGAVRIVQESQDSQFIETTEADLFLENLDPSKIYKKNDIEFIYVKNSRQALAILSAKAENFPANKLKIIGITGTKGKTTTTYMIEHVLEYAGFRTALFGSVKNKILDVESKSKLTTMESDELQVALGECVRQKVDYVVMEVSSHALSLERTLGIKFDAVGFTNLASEHMDFYSGINQYFEAKCKIFDQIKENGMMVLNLDNDWSKKAFLNINKNIKNIDCFGKIKPEFLNELNSNFYELRNESSTDTLLKIKSNNDSLKISSTKIFGDFNCYNFAMAVLICKSLGISKKLIEEALTSFVGVPGRLQMHKLKNEARAFVDHAHNPSSIEAVLEELRKISKDLIVVFGCGGDRDKTKRPVMGQIAAQFADKLIITSDNSRNEEPAIIIQEILAGIDKNHINKVEVEIDRETAIKKAAEISSSSSTIAILGKGHEEYLIVKDQYIPFSDFEQISRY